VSSEPISDDVCNLFHTAPVPVHLVGPDGTILAASAATLDMLGYRIEDYVGHHLSEFHVDVGAGVDLARRLSRGEALRDVEARLRGAGGAVKHVLLTSSAHVEAGRVLHTRCFMRDVDDARMAERRLAVQYRVAQILSARTDVLDGVRRTLAAVCDELDWDVGEVWRRDADADVLRLLVSVERPGIEADALTRLARDSAFARGAGLPGHVWATGTPEWLDDVAKAPMLERAPAAAAAAAGLHTGCGIPIVLDADDAAVMVCLRREAEPADEAAVRTLRLVAGQIGQFLARKRVEEERERLIARERQVRLEAEAANRAKDEFLAAVSHELRTPLNAILGWSRLLRSSVLDAETVARGLAAIERNAEAQEQLIADLLDVARIVTGKVRLRLEPIDLAAVIEAAADAVRHAADARRVALAVRLPGPVPLILGDGDRLRQVVWNLLSNAIRFTPEAGHVDVELHVADGRATIRVADDGIGIAPEFLPHVFDRFRQGEVGTTRRQGGLGLGLSIVRHLTELHGGTVRAESAGEGRGARFTVELPTIEPETTVVDSAAEAARDEMPADSLAHLRVLIVDDDADAREMLGMVLRHQGAEVVGAGSADHAIAVFRREAPDVVVSDIGLPDADGYELIRRLRALETPAARTALAIALTGWARSEDRHAALAAGFQAHVVKPVDVTELVRLIGSLTRRESSPVDGTGIALL
jgi:PAS domain S-box-containing protein